MRALITWKSCTIGMRNAILRNYLKGENDGILVSHSLLLARYYIYCCKFKNVSPSIREYAQQLKYNLEIEKQISTVTDSKINFSRSGAKYFMHYNCYIVCGQALNVSLLAGSTVLTLP